MQTQIRYRMLRCLIRVFTLSSVQNVSFKYGKNITNTPKIRNGLVLLIRVGRSFWLKWVKVKFLVSLVWLSFIRLEYLAIQNSVIAPRYFIRILTAKKQSRHVMLLIGQTNAQLPSMTYCPQRLQGTNI